MILAKTKSLSFDITLTDESGNTVYKVSGDVTHGMGYGFGEGHGIAVGDKLLIGFTFQPYFVEIPRNIKGDMH